MADIVLTIRRLADASLHAELRIALPGGAAILGEAQVSIDPEQRLGLSADPEAYGAALTAMALPAPLHAAWQRARGHAERLGEGLHPQRLSPHTQRWTGGAKRV